MVGKTHIAVGIAAALGVTQPRTVGGCLAAVLGGAAGGIICDLDSIHMPRHSRSTRRARSADRVSFRMTQANVGRIIFGVIAIIVLTLDIVLQGGIISSIIYRHPKLRLGGIAVIVALALSGMYAHEKSYAHSLMYIVEFTAGVYCLCPMLAIPFAAGGLTHIILDFVNKGPIPVLYPWKKKWCLSWCYPDGTANMVTLIVSLIADVGMLSFFLYRIYV